MTLAYLITISVKHIEINFQIDAHRIAETISHSL